MIKTTICLLAGLVISAGALFSPGKEAAEAAGPINVAGPWTFTVDDPSPLPPDICTTTMTQGGTSITFDGFACSGSGATGSMAGTINTMSGSYNVSGLVSSPSAGLFLLTVSGTFSKDGRTEIGTFVTSLPTSGTFDGVVKVSPKDFGFKIAFFGDRDGNPEIYVMNADGTGQARLTNETLVDTEPAWSPDGTKIAFASQRDGNFDVYVMNADGSNPTNLTNYPPGGDGHPSWSPDGSKVAFHSNRDSNFEIYTMNADGSDQIRLTNDGAFDALPVWSPDGTQIAFQSDRDGDSNVYTMNANGTGQTAFTTAGSEEGQPAWSPDGTKIAFHSNSSGDYDVCYTQIGNGITCLSTAGDQQNPAWKAGNEKIAFQSEKPGDTSVELYVWTLGGSGHAKVTDNAAFDGNADWRRTSGPGLDFDKDGCTDAKEAGQNQALGGRRNPQHFWDFFDTPNASNVRDKAVAGSDFFGLLARFNSTGSASIDPLSAPPPAPAYHTAYDRGSAPAGQDPWDLTAANGAIAGTDFLGLLGQFGHSCA